MAGPALQAPGEWTEEALGKGSFLAGATCQLSQATSVPCHEGGPVCLCVLRALVSSQQPQSTTSVSPPLPFPVTGPLQSSRGVRDSMLSTNMHRVPAPVLGTENETGIERTPLSVGRLLIKEQIYTIYMSLMGH